MTNMTMVANALVGSKLERIGNMIEENIAIGEWNMVDETNFIFEEFVSVSFEMNVGIVLEFEVTISNPKVITREQLEVVVGVESTDDEVLKSINDEVMKMVNKF